MKFLILILSLLLSSTSFADQVKIELNPAKPVVGEVFQAIFHIYSDEDSEPVINFSPFRVEVVGKNNYGIKTSTVYANGKFSTTREMTIVYELGAQKEGIASLRDITVQVGSKTIRHPTMTFNILKEPEVAPDVFVMADVPKKNLFLGEGIVVRYHLYSKAPVSNLDIKKYPKLDNFLKRFLQEPDRTERVSVDGEIYNRAQIYGVKLFPEKIGEIKVDPLTLSATIITGRGADPFGTFGMSGQPRTKTISSESVKITVRPLPEEGKTPAFTGLVGAHTFDLQMNNSRLIVNEPLELKLTVSGGGALENMEAPVILKHPNLEEFESNGDLKIMDADQATKVFDYTFLPKADFSLPASTLTLTYFDPETMKYVPVNLPLNEVVVVGGAPGEKKENRKNDSEKKEEATFQAPKVPTNLAEPLLRGAKSWKSWLNYVNLGLAVLAVAIATGFVIRKDSLPSFTKHSIPSEFKKGRFSLSHFVRWMTPLIAQTGKSPLGVIKDSDLSQEAKSYFVDLLNSNDYKDYASTKGQMKFVYNANSFKELDRYIQKAKHENSSPLT